MVCTFKLFFFVFTNTLYYVAILCQSGDCWRRRVVALSSYREKCCLWQRGPQPTRPRPGSSLGFLGLLLAWCPRQKRSFRYICVTSRTFYCARFA